jgi:hypothetical protein
VRFSYRKSSKKTGVAFLILLLASLIVAFPLLPSAFSLPTENSVGAPLTLKWTVKPANAHTMYGALAAKLIPGSDGLQLIITGGADPITEDPSSQGDVLALSGVDGEVLWRASDYQMGIHNPFQIVDLDADGDLEVVIAAWNRTIALNGEDGSLFWSVDVGSDDLLPVCADVDGDGYPEVFVSSGNGPYAGSDWISMISHDGNVLRQAYSWHPCFGGLALGDTNGDGRYELYQGDRPISYGEWDEPNQGGGLGVRAFDAATLTPLWNFPWPLSNSHAPVLVDVDLDGVIDVVTVDQQANGTVVLNSVDGSVLTTGGKYRMGWTNMSSHSQPTVGDLNGDGYPEIISSDYSQVKIWDLYHWEALPGLLDELGNPLIAPEPPKVGNVTGGPYPNIIAAADPDDTNPYENQRDHVYIYEYNSTTGEFDIFQKIEEEFWEGARNFSLVADVDEDGLNEVVFTSTGGRIWCYDTSVVSDPGVRSDTQFYSQMNRGAGEPVPLLVPHTPVIANEMPKNGALNVDLNPTLSVNVIDYQQDELDITFSVFTSGSWRMIGFLKNVLPGIYGVNTAGMFEKGSTYRWRVQVSDGKNPPVSEEYVFTTISTEPSQDAPEIIPRNGTLVCSSVNTTDVDGDTVTNIYSWTVDGEPFASMQFPFDTRTPVNPIITEQMFFDGFETSLANWKGINGVNWSLSTAQKHSGSYSAYASVGDTALTSTNLDTSKVESLTISFWYRNHQVSAMNLQLWDGVSYRNVVDLGASTPDDHWHYYTLQTYDPDFLATDFRVRFSPAGNMGEHEEFWIDDFSVCRSFSIVDYSGHANHGTIHGPTWIDDGVVGGAYSFDGVNDYIYVPDDPSLCGDGNSSELGIEFWVNPSELRSGSRIIVKKTPSQSAGSYMVGFQSSDSYNTLFFGVMSTVDERWHEVSDENLTNIPVDEWSHVVCTYKSGEGLSIYINGQLRVNSPLTGNISVGPESPSSIYGRPVFIGFDGSWDSYRWFAGSLDEVTIYPRALSSSQVLQRYLETKDGLSGNSTIVVEETLETGTWICKVTPNDGYGDGQTHTTTSITLSPFLPTPPSTSNDATSTNSPDTSYTPQQSPSDSHEEQNQEPPWDGSGKELPSNEKPKDKTIDSTDFPRNEITAILAVIVIVILTSLTTLLMIVRRRK